MLIFHTTTSENAEQIKLNGFEDPQAKVVGGYDCVPMEEGTYFADQAMIDEPALKRWFMAKRSLKTIVIKPIRAVIFTEAGVIELFRPDS